MPVGGRKKARDRTLLIFLGAVFFLAALEVMTGVWIGYIPLLAHAAYIGTKLFIPALIALAGDQTGLPGTSPVADPVGPGRRFAGASSLLFGALGTVLLWSAAAVPYFKPYNVRPGWFAAAAILPFIMAVAIVCRAAAVEERRRKSLLRAVIAGHFRAALLLLVAVPAAAGAAAVGCRWPGFLATAGTGLLILLEAVAAARQALGPAETFLPPGAAAAIGRQVLKINGVVALLRVKALPGKNGLILRLQIGLADGVTAENTRLLAESVRETVVSNFPEVDAVQVCAVPLALERLNRLECRYKAAGPIKLNEEGDC